MRTSINLPDSLLEAVKLQARAQGRTVTSLVEEALRNALAAAEVPGVPPPLPTYGEPGGRFVVDPADREQLWAALDADGAR